MIVCLMNQGTPSPLERAGERCPTDRREVIREFIFSKLKEVKEGICSANIIKECPFGQKSYKSIQICQNFLFFTIEICLIYKDLEDFSPKATQKDDSLNGY